MQIRRRYAVVLAALGALASAGTVHAQLGAAPTSQPENSLLGIRLLDSYKTVLRRFGQPAEIQVGMPVDQGGAGDAGGAEGGMPGMGMPGMGSPGSAGGMMGGRGGMMGGSGGMMPGSGGIPGSGGPSLPGFGGPGGGRGGMGGSGGMMPGSGGGMPGMPGSGGMMPGGAGGGANGAAANVLPTIPGSGNGSTGPSEEAVWWYKFPNEGLFYAFLINKQGQVIQIGAHGYRPKPPVPLARTAKGVALGASMGNVLKNYGWSNDGEHVGDYVVLRYNSRDRLPGGHGKLAFQVLHNQVVGITVGYVK